MSNRKAPQSPCSHLRVPRDTHLILDKAHTVPKRVSHTPRPGQLGQENAGQAMLGAQGGMGHFTQGAPEVVVSVGVGKRAVGPGSQPGDPETKTSICGRNQHVPAPST